MANPEHVALVRAGEAALNEREQRLGSLEPKQLDLSGADLRGLQLFRTSLFAADLSGANLNDASFIAVDMTRANLRGANLTWATFVSSILSRANLSNAILQHGGLLRANFSEATLVGADLSHARLGASVFGDTDLSNVQGLETLTHYGPSVLDHATLVRSGMLPIPFLRGCGLPDAYIKVLPTLLGVSDQFYTCFISHSSRDQLLAERLHADLQNRGVRCWYAREDLRIGDVFRQQIDQAIRVHDKLLLLLSQHSVESDWVQAEVETAIEKEQRTKRPVLFPIMLDDAVITTDKAWARHIRRTRHIGDFTRWKNADRYQEAFDRLLWDLRSDAPSIHVGSSVDGKTATGG